MVTPRVRTFFSQLCTVYTEGGSAKIIMKSLFNKTTALILNLPIFFQNGVQFVIMENCFWQKKFNIFFTQ